MYKTLSDTIYRGEGTVDSQNVTAKVDRFSANTYLEYNWRVGWARRTPG